VIAATRAYALWVTISGALRVAIFLVVVDDVKQDFEELKLDHPAGEDRELTELGEAKGGTVVWPKEHIVLPNYVAVKATHSSEQQSTFADTSPFSSATVAFTASPLSAAVFTAASAVSVP
jgi:hypothetical protein